MSSSPSEATSCSNEFAANLSALSNGAKQVLSMEDLYLSMTRQTFTGSQACVGNPSISGYKKPTSSWIPWKTSIIEKTIPHYHSLDADYFDSTYSSENEIKKMDHWLDSLNQVISPLETKKTEIKNELEKINNQVKKHDSLIQLEKKLVL
ncbi:MAG: hypothetical protein KA715_05210 [Xanthomonadaceae bacterium]|nr:hypothetical protein [Xanthomonadaceae bacterium]